MVDPDGREGGLHGERILLVEFREDIEIDIPKEVDEALIDDHHSNFSLERITRPIREGHIERD